MKNIIQKIWHLDLVILYGFLIICFYFAHEIGTPTVMDNALLVKIPLYFILSSWLTLVITSSITKRFLNRMKASPFLTFPPTELTYYLIVGVVLALVLATFVSWSFAFVKYSNLLNISPIHGMRAITTSLHALVPLESRILFVLLPTVLLYPTPRKIKIISAIFCFFLLLFAFATQTKLGYLFSSIVLFYVVGISNIFFNTNKIKYSLSTGLFLLAFTIFGLVIIKNDDPNADGLVTEQSIKLQTQVQANLSNEGTYVCSASRKFVYDRKADIGESDLSFKSIYQGLKTRTFLTSAQMIRLFVCLREQNWKPNFRGHQLFKLINGYIPYYRFAYEIFRPGKGNSISSAVTNVAADAYFNLGFQGVILSGVTVGLIWFALNLVSAQTQFLPLLIFIKLYMVEVLSQLSILSALVTVTPLLTILAFDFLLNYKKIIKLEA